MNSYLRSPTPRVSSFLIFLLHFPFSFSFVSERRTSDSPRDSTPSCHSFQNCLPYSGHVYSARTRNTPGGTRSHEHASPSPRSRSSASTRHNSLQRNAWKRISFLPFQRIVSIPDGQYKRVLIYLSRLRDVCKSVFTDCKRQDGCRLFHTTWLILLVIISTTKHETISDEARQLSFQFNMAVGTFQTLDVPTLLGDHQEVLIINHMTTTTAGVGFTARLHITVRLMEWHQLGKGYTRLGIGQ